jgi:PKD repeat protein
MLATLSVTYPHALADIAPPPQGYIETTNQNGNPQQAYSIGDMIYVHFGFTSDYGGQGPEAIVTETLPDGSSNVVFDQTITFNQDYVISGTAAAPLGVRTFTLGVNMGAHCLGLLTCSTTGSFVSVASASAEVTGTPLQVSISASPTSGTTPLTVSFSSQVSGGVSPYSYSWTFGNGDSSNDANPTYTYSNPGTYTATLTVTDSSGSQASATTTISSTMQTFCLTVKAQTVSNGNPISVSATINGAPSGCNYTSGQSLTLTAQESSSDGYYFLAWLEDGILSGTTNSLQVTMNPNHNVVAVYLSLNVLQNFGDGIGSIGSQDYIESVASKIATDAWNGATQTTIDSTNIAASLQPILDVLTSLGATNLPSIPIVGFTIDVSTIAKDLTQCSSNPPGSSCNPQKAISDMNSISGSALLGIATTVICAGLSVPTVGIAGFACAIGAVVLAEVHAPGQSMNFGQWLGSQVNTWFYNNIYSRVTNWWRGVWAKIEGGSSVVLMVQDAQGRRIGASLQSGNIATYSEIPGAIYSGAQSHPQQILILQPVQSAYKVLVTGIGSAGSYSLTASLTDNNGNLVSTVSGNGFVLGGQTQSLSANFSSNKISVTGLWPYPPLTVAIIAVIAVGITAIAFMMRKRVAFDYSSEGRGRTGVKVYATCPNCGQVVSEEEDCQNCGQRLR